MCFHRNTARGFGSISATHCEQRLQLRNRKYLPRLAQEVTRSADACLSLACVAFKLCVVVKWSGYVQQGTGVQLLTVEQECLLLGTNVTHSEVQNLFSLPNATKIAKTITKKMKIITTKKISKQKTTTKRDCLVCLCAPSFPLTLTSPKNSEGANGASVRMQND